MLILESSIFEAEYAYQEFAPLDEYLLAQYGIDSSKFCFVEANSHNYASVIFDKVQDISLLPDYLTVCDPSKQYCIVVNVNTPNAAPFSTGKNTTNHAFLALSQLLGTVY